MSNARWGGYDITHLNQSRDYDLDATTPEHEGCVNKRYLDFSTLAIWKKGKHTMVVTIQVENMSVNIRRSNLSAKPRNKGSGTMSRIELANASAKSLSEKNI